MDQQFNVSNDYANESPTALLHYPRISEDVFQWKSKQKPKKGKSPYDEGRTDATSEWSTIDGTGDVSDGEGSSNVALPSQSSYSVSSKKSKKRSHPKKVASENSENAANADFKIIYERSPEKESLKEYSPYATLSCPVCSDPECILNVAATCPLLRHNEEEATQCQLCEENCECDKCMLKFLPVSGLVARDENGVAETLLKKNGGPIENSLEWSRRNRWVVPYGISWDHQINEWITARMRETSKSTLEGSNRKRTKSKKKKSKHTSTPTGTPSQVAMGNENSAQEEKGEDAKVILEGNGFKIFARGQEKVLVNFDRKNCKYLGCSCKTESTTPNCGCNNWAEESHCKISGKKEKSCKSRKSPRISLMKETSQGLMEVCAKDLEKCEKSNQVILTDKSERNEHETDEVKVEKTDSSENRQRRSKESPEKQEGKKAKTDKIDDDSFSITRSHNLSARDVRNFSRAEVLEEHLKSILGATYRADGQPNVQLSGSPPEGSPMMNRMPDQESADMMMLPMEMAGPCMCAERYWYTSA